MIELLALSTQLDFALNRTREIVAKRIFALDQTDCSTFFSAVSFNQFMQGMPKDIQHQFAQYIEEINFAHFQKICERAGGLWRLLDENILEASRAKINDLLSQQPIPPNLFSNIKRIFDVEYLAQGNIRGQNFNELLNFLTEGNIVSKERVRIALIKRAFELNSHDDTSNLLSTSNFLDYMERTPEETQRHFAEHMKEIDFTQFQKLRRRTMKLWGLIDKNMFDASKEKISALLAQAPQPPKLFFEVKRIFALEYLEKGDLQEQDFNRLLDLLTRGDLVPRAHAQTALMRRAFTLNQNDCSDLLSPVSFFEFMTDMPEDVQYSFARYIEQIDFTNFQKIKNGSSPFWRRIDENTLHASKEKISCLLARQPLPPNLFAEVDNILISTYLEVGNIRREDLSGFADLLKQNAFVQHRETFVRALLRCENVRLNDLTALLQHKAFDNHREAFVQTVLHCDKAKFAELTRLTYEKEPIPPFEYRLPYGGHTFLPAYFPPHLERLVRGRYFACPSISSQNKKSLSEAENPRFLFKLSRHLAFGMLLPAFAMYMMLAAGMVNNAMLLPLAILLITLSVFLVGQTFFRAAKEYENRILHYLILACFLGMTALSMIKTPILSVGPILLGLLFWGYDAFKWLRQRAPEKHRRAINTTGIVLLLGIWTAITLTVAGLAVFSYNTLAHFFMSTELHGLIVLAVNTVLIIAAFAWRVRDDWHATERYTEGYLNHQERQHLAAPPSNDPAPRAAVMVETGPLEAGPEEKKDHETETTDKVEPVQKGKNHGTEVIRKRDVTPTPKTSGAQFYEWLCSFGHFNKRVEDAALRESLLSAPNTNLGDTFDAPKGPQ